MNTWRIWQDHILNVAVNGHPADVAVPFPIVATVDRTTLKLSYSEVLNSTAPAASAFSVSVSGGAAPPFRQIPSSVSIKGPLVTLTLPTAVGAGATATLSYTPPATNPLQDEAGNAAHSFAARPVRVLTTVPRLVGASLFGAGLRLNYSEELNATAPPASAFTVRVDRRTVSLASRMPPGKAEKPAVEIQGSTVLLRLATPITPKPGQTVTVTYRAPPVNPLRDLSGTRAADFVDRDVLGPIFLSGRADANPTSVTLVYDEQLARGAVPKPSAFTVNLVEERTEQRRFGTSPTSMGELVDVVVDHVVGTVAVESVEVDGFVVRLGLAEELTHGQLLTVSYTRGPRALRDWRGNEALDLQSWRMTARDRTVPSLLRAIIPVDDNVLRLAYDEELDMESLPPRSAYTVKVDGAVVGPSAPNPEVKFTVGSRSTIEMRLADVVTFGQTVTVSYDKGESPNRIATPVRDLVGNEAAELNDQAVEVRDEQEPVLGTATLDVEADTPGVAWLRLNYNEPLDVTSRPALSAFEVKVAGRVVELASVLVGGETVGLQLSEAPVLNGQDATVTYEPPAANPIRDPSGNRARKLVAHPVAVADRVAPSLLRAATAGKKLSLFYDEQLSTASKPAAEDFTLRVGVGDEQVTLGLSEVVVSGSTIVMTQSAKAIGQPVVLSYARGETPVRDRRGNAAAGFSGVEVLDRTAPGLSSATALGKLLQLKFDEPLDADSVPEAEAFTVRLNREAVALAAADAVSVTGSTVTLMLAAVPGNSGQMDVGYAQGTTPLRDVVGNEVVDFKDRAVAVAISDRTAPSLVSAVEAHNVLTLSYDEELDGESVPAATDFTVMADGVFTHDFADQGAVRVESNRVLLSLKVSPSSGQVVTVSYAKGTNPILDTAGNEAPALSEQAVFVQDTEAPVVTTTPPEHSCHRLYFHLCPVVGVIRGDVLTVAYDEKLDATSVPSPSDYVVSVVSEDTERRTRDGSTFEVTVHLPVRTVEVLSVAVVGNEVRLKLAETLLSGHRVTLAYTRGANPVQDPFGNQGRSFAFTDAGTGLVTIADATAPSLIRAVVDGTKLRLIYDEDLNAFSAPRPSAFTVKLGASGSRRGSVTSVAVAGSAVTLTLAAATAGQAVTVSYAAPFAHPVQDQAGNRAANLVDQAVVPLRPLLGDALLAGTTLTLSYDRTLDAASVPAADDFTVKLAGSEVGLSGNSPVTVAGLTVTLELARAPTFTQSVTVSYARGANPLRDAGGRNAGEFSDRAVEVRHDTEAPVLFSAELNQARSTVMLTYARADGKVDNAVLDTGSVPATNAFMVKVNGNAVSRSTPSITGSTLAIPLITTVEFGQTVTVSYTMPATNPLQDTNGNAVANLVDQPVTLPNGPPVATISPLTTHVVPTGAVVQLDGSMSADPEGLDVTHSWSASNNAGTDVTAATLSATDAATTSFSAGAAGVYTVVLTVADPAGGASTVSLRLHVYSAVSITPGGDLSVDQYEVLELSVGGATAAPVGVALAGVGGGAAGVGGALTYYWTVHDAGELEDSGLVVDDLFEDVLFGSGQDVTSETVALRFDDPGLGNYVVRVAATDAEGGVVARAEVAVAVTAAVPGLRLSQEAVSVAESGEETYAVTLRTPPSDDVSVLISSDDVRVARVSRSRLTFTPSNWDEPQTLRVIASDDDLDNPGDARTASIAHRIESAGTDYSGLGAVMLAVTAVDDDTRGVTVSTEALAVDEGGGTASYEVALASQPTGPVTVPVESSSPSIATVNRRALVFTTANWNTPQTVTVTGKEDAAVNTPDRTATITHTATGADYAGVTATVTVTVNDNDIAGLMVSHTAVNMGEAGGTATYTVRLRTAPSADVTVTPVSDAPGVASVSGALTFTALNWATTQTVTVTGVADDIDNVGDQRMTTIRHGVTSDDADYEGLAPTPAVRVTATDDDAAALVVVDPGLELNSADPSGTYTIVLATQPAADVTVMIASDDLTAATVNSPLTFTTANWNVAQSVTVTATAPDDTSTHGTVTLTHTVTSTDSKYAGQTVPNVQVEIAPPLPGLVFSSTTLSVAEAGGTMTYTVALDEQPDAAVTVTPVSSDATVASVSGALTFTTADWATAQTVTVTGVDDDIDNVDDQRMTTIGHSLVSGATSVERDAGVTVTATDDDTAALVVVDPGLELSTADPSGTYTIVLVTEPAADVTVMIASDDLTAATVTSSLTFTAGNWNTPQTVTVTATDADDTATHGTVTLTHTVTSTDSKYAGLDVDDVEAEVAPALPGLVLSDTTLSVYEDETAGMTTATYTVALDEQPNAAVTVTPMSSDATVATVSPAELTFTTANWNTMQTVMVTGVDDDIDNSGDQRMATIGHRLVSGDDDVESRNVVMVTVTDEDTVGLEISPTMLQVDAEGMETYRVKLVSQPTASVTVTIASNKAIATVSPDELTFDATDWNMLKPVTVTAMAIDDPQVDKVDVTLTHTVESTDSKYNGLDVDDVEVEVISPARERIAMAVKMTQPEFLRLAMDFAVEAITARLSPGGRDPSGSPLGLVGRLLNASGLVNTGYLPKMEILAQPGHSGAGGGSAPAASAASVPMGGLPAAGAGIGHAATQGIGLSRGLGDASVWASGGYRKQNGDDGGVMDWSGDAYHVHIGIDKPFGDVIGGLSVGYFRGDFDYVDRTGGRTAGGSIDTELTSVQPYLGWRPSERLNMWGMIGYGEGDIDVRDGDDEVQSSDADQRMIALGGSYRLGGDPSTVQLDLKAEVSAGQLEIDGNGDMIEETSVSSSRWRLAVEGTREMELEDGRRLLPSLGLGARLDRGDGVNGAGVELNAGLDYHDAANGLLVQTDVRWMPAYGSSERLREWAASGAIRMLPQESGRGLSFELSQSWGDVASGVERLWNDGASQGWGGAASAGPRLETRLGYGLLGMDGLLTPYFGATHGGERSSLMLGADWQRGRTSFSLRGERSAGAEQDYSLRLELSTSW